MTNFSRKLYQRIFSSLDNILSNHHRNKTYISRESLLSQAKPSDIHLHSFGDIEALDFPAAEGVQTIPQEMLSKPIPSTLPPSFLIEVDNAKLRGKHAVAFSSRDELILESLLNHEPLIQMASIGDIHYPRSTKEFFHQAFNYPHYDTLFVLVNIWSRGYYHWILEALPRLYAYKRLIAEKQISGKLLIDSHAPAYVTDSLKLFGFAESDWLEWHSTKAKVKRLLIPGMPQTTSFQSPRLCQWVREELLQAVAPAENLPKNERLYISRANARNRRVLNEDEVLAELRPLGFQVIQPESLSLAEQINVFRQAKVIIGPHGGGFTNLLFATHASVLEFFEPSYINACYYHLSTSLGSRYYYLLGRGQQQNITIDIDLFRTIIGRML